MPTTKGLCSSFKRRSTSDPDNPDAYYNLASTYHQLGKLHKNESQLAQAESYYHRCLDHSPNHEDCYRGLAVLLVKRGHPDQAHELLDRWAQRSPTIPGPKIELARLAEEQGDKQGAQRDLIEAITVDPHNAEPWQPWADCVKRLVIPRKPWLIINDR